MARTQSNVSVGTKGWADRINAAWQSSIDGIIEAGRVLTEAKAVLPSSEFEDLIDKRLRFSASVARRLIIVAADSRLCAHVHTLPAHWSTLYELTKLDDDEFDQALKDGTIRADMERKDVPKKRKETPQGAAVLEVGSGVPAGPPADDGSTPQDDREDEDSGVTDSERAAAVDPERKPPEAHSEAVDGAGGSSETNARQSGPADGRRSWARGEEDEQRRASAVEAGGSPVIIDQTSRFAIGLAMAMSASREMDPTTAAASYPEDRPLLLGEITEFINWLDGFEDEFRERFGAGNDAGLRLP